jgi:prepilin-type N-terminal cleavage/methylation domain-containing protein
VARRGRVGRAFRRGFTFTEVMFAVILLGIGFIMLAGMFPVAIQQTQTNVQESTASTTAQGAARYMEQSLTQDDVGPTYDIGTSPYPRFFRLTERYDAKLKVFNPTDMTLWDKLRGGFILPQDPRFA